MPNAKHEYYLRRVSVGVEGGGGVIIERLKEYNNVTMVYK